MLKIENGDKDSTVITGMVFNMRAKTMCWNITVKFIFEP